MSQDISLERVSYHEAGHAVASYLVGVKFSHVTIVPEKNRLGYLKNSKTEQKRAMFLSDKYQKLNDYTRKRILICVAGSVAENLYTKDGIRLGAYDLDEAWLLAYCLSISDRGKWPLTPWDYYYEVEDKFKEELIWKAIETLASELLVRRTIGYRAAVEIIEKIILDFPTST